MRFSFFNISAFTRGIALWLMPAVLSTVSSSRWFSRPANPVIEQWVSLLNLQNSSSEYISIPRGCCSGP